MVRGPNGTGTLGRAVLGRKMMNFILSILSGKYFYISLELILQDR